MTRLRALIVDDEPLSRRAMRQLLDLEGGVETVGECSDAADAAERLADADVIFLDVLMPQRSGLDLARSLPGAGPPFIVFVSAYDEYALPAFETEAVDYLSKPVARDRLAKALGRVRERLRATREAAGGDAPADVSAEAEAKSPARLVARVGGKEVLIASSDIECIEADGVYAGVFALGRRYLVRSSLDALERRLSPASFIRVHRSWIVPRAGVVAIRRSVRGSHREVVLRSGMVAPVSRRRQREVMRALRRSVGGGE